MGETVINWNRPGEPTPPPKCHTCDDPLGGSPGNWYSLITQREQCGEPFHYHEPGTTILNEEINEDS